MKQLTPEEYIAFQKSTHDGRPEDTDAFYAEHFTPTFVNHRGANMTLEQQKAGVRADREACRAAFPVSLPWIVQDGLRLSARSVGAFSGDWSLRGLSGGHAIVAHMIKFTEEGKRAGYIHVTRFLKEDDEPVNVAEVRTDASEQPPKRMDGKAFGQVLQMAQEGKLLHDKLARWVDGRNYDKASWLEHASKTKQPWRVQEAEFVVQQGLQISAHVYWTAHSADGGADQQIESVEDCLFDRDSHHLTQWVSVSRIMPASEERWSLGDHH